MSGKHAYGKKIFIYALRIALTLIIGLFLLKRVGLEQLAETFDGADFYFIYAAMPFLIFFNACKIFKWYLLLSPWRHSLKKAASSYLAGMSIGIITPVRAGELLRAMSFPQDERWKIGGLVFVDRLIEVFAITAIAGIAVMFYWSPIVGSVLTTLAAVGLIILCHPQKTILELALILSKLPGMGKIEELFSWSNELNRKKVILSFLVSLLCYSLSISQFYLLLSAFWDVPIVVVFLGAPLVVLSNAIPVTIGGLGIREGVSAMIFSSFNIPETAAINAAFLLFVMNTLVPGIIGLYFFYHTLAVEKSK